MLCRNHDEEAARSFVERKGSEHIYMDPEILSSLSGHSYAVTSRSLLKTDVSFTALAVARECGCDHDLYLTRQIAELLAATDFLISA